MSQGSLLEELHLPLDLGWFMLCLGVSDMDSSLDFYRRLGFNVVGGEPGNGWAILNNATTELGLYTFFGGPLLNFRGADIQKLNAELRERGIDLANESQFDAAEYPPEWAQDRTGQPLPLEGAGSFSTSDPDRNMLFFDTVPVEYVRYRAGSRFCSPIATGELVGGQLPLGRSTWCLNVSSIAASIGFYTRLGLEMIEDHGIDGWAVVGSSRLGYQLSLFQGHISENIFNFRGGDVFALHEELLRRGLRFETAAQIEDDGSVGATLRDPDGYLIYLNTAAGEQEL